jgi:hypothetical protein
MLAGCDRCESIEAYYNMEYDLLRMHGLKLKNHPMSHELRCSQILAINRNEQAK